MDKALATMSESVRLARLVENLTPLTGTQADLGWTYGLLGAIDHGFDFACQALATAEEKLPILAAWPQAILVLLYLFRGDIAAGETMSLKLPDYAEIRDGFGYMPFMWIRVGLAKAELAMSKKNYDLAGVLADQICDDLRAGGIRYLRPDVLLLKGRSLLAREPDRVEEAVAILQQARAEAEALGSRRTLWPILAILGNLEQEQGRMAEANKLRQQAREIIRYIVDHTTTPELKRSFLGLPAVKALLPDPPG